MVAFSASHQEAINFRDELLRNRWQNDYHAAESIGAPTSADAGAFMANARASGLLLGVWSEAQCGFVYPDFQFDRHGKLRREVAKLLTLLPSDDDRAGWHRAFWLYSPHALLDNLLPAVVFASDPDRVFKAAAQEFSGDSNAAW